MSAQPADTLLARVASPSLLGVPSPSSGVTRSRDEFDADIDDESDRMSPHPAKLARMTLDNDAVTQAVEKAATTTKDQEEQACSEDTASTDPTVIALLDELECGMCAGVYIDPVALNGCGHVFCGSCVTQWIKSLPRYSASLLPGDPVPDPISCPQCRHAPIQTATPSRVAKTMTDVLLNAYPAAARPPNEHTQARELYQPSTGVLKFPAPPPAPRLHERDFWRPCRWCYTEGGGWRCPVPVPRFEVPEERPRCLRADSFPPDGHRLCAGCNAPTSVECGICGEGFCGSPHTGCDCLPASQSKPSAPYVSIVHLLDDCPTDMIAMAFKDNWTEMTALARYIDTSGASCSVETIYQDILTWLRSPAGIDAGGVLGLMKRGECGLRLRVGAANEMQQTIMPVEAGSAEAKICSGCADELLCSGLYEWWMRELQKPEVIAKIPDNMKGRPNCKDGRKCDRQDNDMHAKKYNHMCNPMSQEEAAQIVQDDSMPVQGGATNPVVPAVPVEDSDAGDTETDTDTEGNDDDDDKVATVDMSVQWEATPTGTKIKVTAAPILSSWGIGQANAATPAPSAQPAVAIANLIHTSSIPPMSRHSGTGRVDAPPPILSHAPPHNVDPRVAAPMPPHVPVPPPIARNPYVFPPPSFGMSYAPHAHYLPPMPTPMLKMQMADPGAPGVAGSSGAVELTTRGSDMDIGS